MIEGRGWHYTGNAFLTAHVGITRILDWPGTFFCVCMYSFACIYRWACLCSHVHMRSRGQCWWLPQLLSYFLRQGFSRNLEQDPEMPPVSASASGLLCHCWELNSCFFYWKPCPNPPVLTSNLWFSCKDKRCVPPSRVYEGRVIEFGVSYILRTPLSPIHECI